MKLDARRFNAITMEFARGNHSLVATRLQFNSESEKMMKVAESSVRCENDAFVSAHPG